VILCHEGEVLDTVEWAMDSLVAVGETQRPIAGFIHGYREDGGCIPNTINGNPMLRFHLPGGRGVLGMHLSPGRTEVRTTTNKRRCFQWEDIVGCTK